ncbi:MAG: undecaprenyl-diphosphate phosphatase [bacterium]|nr:undecaprenyl-diphosphate phosphatase [bacterium]
MTITKNSYTRGEIAVLLLLAVFIAAALLYLGVQYYEQRQGRVGEPLSQFTYGQSFALGVVEGVTEFLPVSSTGHLELVSYFLDMQTPEAKRAVNAFNIVIQGAALLAIVGLYRKRVGEMIYGLFNRNDSGRKLLINLFVSFFPAAAVGLLFDDMIESYLFNPAAIAGALVVGGVLMIWLERRQRKTNGTGGLEIDAMTWRMALIVGIAQIFSMWPGTSRSMATILGAMIAGLSLPAAAEYSFLLALPTLGAASLYKLAKEASAIFDFASPGVFTVGMVVSAVVAALAVKGFIQFLARGGLAPFGYYRIILGVAVLWLIS